MSCCLRRTLHLHFKYYMTSQTYGPKFYSVLYPLSYKASSKFNAKKDKYLMVHDPKLIQYRHLSVESIQNFYTNFFHSVTSSEASRIVKESLFWIHDVSGLPWWGTIIVATVGLRCFFGLPIGIYQQYLGAKINLTKLELDSIAKKVKEDVLIEAKRGRWTKEKATLKLKLELHKQWKVLVVKNNCHPFKTVILSLCQLPVWVLMSLTLRKFAMDAGAGTSDSMVEALQFEFGGALWFRDLTIPDSTCILPLALSLFSLLAIEVNVLSGHALRLLSKILINVLRGFSILSFFVSALVPSGVCLYWAVGAMLTFAQALLLLSPRMRRIFRIPKTPKELEKPYSHIWLKFQEKFGKTPERK